MTQTLFLSFRVFRLLSSSLFTTFWPICPPAFFRCYLSNSVAYRELWTTSFIWSTRVACSGSVNHNRVQVLSIPVLLLACSQNWTCSLQLIVQDTWHNGHTRWFSKLLSDNLSLIQGHLKVLNLLSFSLLLYFHESHISQAFLYLLWFSTTRYI